MPGDLACLSGLFREFKRLFMRLVVFILFICTACQSGLLPCPKGNTAKLRRNNFHNSFRESMLSLSARNEDDRTDNVHYKTSKSNEGKSIQNVSVEEWDFPRPGAKKYLPKSVRENIKKNMKKIKSSSVNKSETSSTDK